MPRRGGRGATNQANYKTVLNEEAVTVAGETSKSPCDGTGWRKRRERG
jgi:hypothetical protein